MKNLVIIGTGAVAAEITSYIDDHNRYVNENDRYFIKGYIDFKENIEKYWSKYHFEKPVLSDIYSYPFSSGEDFIVAVSDLPFRLKMINYLNEKKANITSFIHHSTLVAKTATIGSGNIIYPNCIIGPNCFIGNNNFITSYSFISHDCVIGDNNFLASAGLSGHVKIKDNNFFGIRSTILPHINIGSGNLIQAGMIIDKDVEDDSTVFYKYKEKIQVIKK